MEDYSVFDEDLFDKRTAPGKTWSEKRGIAELSGMYCAAVFL